MANLTAKVSLSKEEDRREYGLEINYYKICKFQFWLTVWLPQWILDEHTPSWKRAKQLANSGGYNTLIYAGACLDPLWTNVYYLK